MLIAIRRRSTDMNKPTGIRAVFVLGLVVLAVAAGACGSGKPAAVRPPAYSTGNAVEQTHADGGVPPEYQGKTRDQLLDLSLTSMGYLGAVNGVIVGQPKLVTVTQGSGPRPGQAPYSDYQLLVKGFVGRGSAPYATGATITLRLPAASATGPNGETVLNPDAASVPTLTPGDEVYAMYHPHPGILGGGHTATRMVPNVGGMFVLHSGVVVAADGTGFAEALPVFLKHFTQ
jgi:hypothetical protein